MASSDDDRHLRSMQVMDRGIAAALLALSTAVLATTFNAELFPMIEDRFERQAVLAPRILLGAVVLLSGAMLARSVLGISPKRQADVDLQDGSGWRRMFAAVAVTTVTAAAMPALGFLLTLAAGVFALGAVMGYRDWITLAVISLVAPLVGWGLIVFVAELSLPRGLLEDLLIRGG